MESEGLTKDAAGVLARLGFTEYEAKTYVALLQHSPATGYQISKEAGIPRSMVYEALGRLANRGAIMSLPSGDTTRYAPQPVNALLDSLRHRYEDALDSAHETLIRIGESTPRDQVWNIEGRDAVLAHARETIRRTQHELLVSIDDRTLVEILSTLREAHDRGVRVRALLSGEAEIDFGDAIRHPQAESSLQQLGGSLVIVSDGGECLIGGDSAGETCVWTGNRHVVFIAQQYIWQEVFSQRVFSRLGKEINTLFSAEERREILGES
ncbi:MAG: helix-turn-helix domain-containing protein [Clostridia bacterium]|nr:helix-turn-helix domain-containing protein [Clostridia bacterium]